MFIAYSLPDEKSTVRLIEYFEIMLAFGVEKIVIYEYDFHPTIADVSFIHIKPKDLENQLFIFI